MELKTAYAFGKTVDMPFAQAQQRAREELAKEGFGVLTEIDVRKKFVEKLQKEFRDYIILGACNPQLAYEALNREINLGTLLPCNVVVYTRDDGKTAVMVMDPVAALSMIGNPEITEIAKQVAEKMWRVLAAL
ncbi:DUF302 domain-containing protein [Geobacter sp. DSM 9736]|uniref:DUF302 domain-containing protein n=1 Tax=Geobacter sp. DSM 9736 TaxID=1277350 RepID=UPI000B50A021|nr:DUF302 domain-containing protein [Geobacter sp. DSM 9736]SNB45528.1 Uncharacterized conserved protein, DUF302 family [Geobacter sp. DSM 9736]